MEEKPALMFVQVRIAAGNGMIRNAIPITGTVPGFRTPLDLHVFLAPDDDLDGGRLLQDLIVMYGPRLTVLGCGALTYDENLIASFEQHKAFGLILRGVEYGVGLGQYIEVT